MAKVVNKLDKVYLHDENGMYYRDHLGSKEAFITKLYPDNPNNLNPASGMITFSQTLTGGHVYDLEEAYVWLNFRLYNTAGNAVYANGAVVSFSPDTFFNEVHIQINTVDINGGYGSKQFCHKGAHLLKLIEYSPERAKMVQAREFFYPGSSQSSTVQQNKYSLWAPVGTVLDASMAAGSIGSTSSSVIIVGAAGGTSAFGVASSAGASVETLGPAVKITDNHYYNEGFAKRRALRNNGHYYACCVPLKYYAPSLRALGDGLANINFKFTFQKPIDAESFIGGNIPIGSCADS